ELIEQIKATIQRMGIDKEGICVESIQTISRRMLSPSYEEEVRRRSFSLVVIDEAHHALAKTYRLLWEAWPQTKFLGLTATPCRLNGKGFTDLFDVLLSSLTVPEFIQKGVLAPFDYVAIREGSRQQLLINSLQKRGADGDYQVKEMNEVLNRGVSIGRLHDAYAQYAPGKKGIVYAISIEHARSIAAYYMERGIKAVAISAQTPAKERAEWLELFRSGEVKVLVNVDIFSEGFDCPDVEFIQLARPTLSLAKYLQMVGRGLRMHQEKACCVILDNVGLVHLFGLPTRCWNWQSAFEGRMVIVKKTEAVDTPSDSELTVVITHERLEELIGQAGLEEWNKQKGILEEETEAFQPEGSRLWGLRCGGKVMVAPAYLRVYNIKEGLAVVRLKDTKLAVVDMQGHTVRNLGRATSALLCSKDFVEVVRPNGKEYLDMWSGQIYYNLPRIISTEGPQLIATANDGLLLRLKDPFVYGRIEGGLYANPVKEYGYFYLVSLSITRPEVDSFAVDTSKLIVLKGDNERAYWLYDVHDDGSIDVIDRQGNGYHVTPDVKREKLNRCQILECSLSVLREIAIRYKSEGRDPGDELDKLHFRNRILFSRLSDKLKSIRG
ncbi:MAG: DEAD/DEAH box helicase, partial [Bacteroides sp.]